MYIVHVRLFLLLPKRATDPKKKKTPFAFCQVIINADNQKVGKCHLKVLGWKQFLLNKNEEETQRTPERTSYLQMFLLFVSSLVHKKKPKEKLQMSKAAATSQVSLLYYIQFSVACFSFSFVVILREVIAFTSSHYICIRKKEEGIKSVHLGTGRPRETALHRDLSGC